MTTTVRLATFNLNGLNQGLPMLNQLCSSCDVIFVQEHWQTPFNMKNILSCSPEFTGFGISAMESKLIVVSFMGDHTVALLSCLETHY